MTYDLLIFLHISRALTTVPKGELGKHLEKAAYVSEETFRKSPLFL
jgi:hypothetical protein